MMKFTRTLAFTMAMVVVLSIAPFSSLAAENKPSSWAQTAVDKATQLGLATADLTKGYQTATTRAEFCRAAVNFLRKYGFGVDGVTPKMFDDTSDKDIGIAAALGITSGTDTAKNLFGPTQTLTREQAAAMLRNVVSVIGAKYDTTAVKWMDAKDVSSWATEAANVMYNAKVMGGTSTIALVFSPKTPYTHEQSIVTLVNLWEFATNSRQTASDTIVYIDGIKVAFPTYIINGEKCLNIRDLAYSLQGTSKEFNVKWVEYSHPDAHDKNGYYVTDGKYIADGAEMKPLSVNLANAQRVPFGGLYANDIWSYLVDGELFAPLKDFAFRLDFEYSENDGAIRINTNKGYHTTAGLEWWKIDPSKLPYLPNWYAPEYSYTLFLAAPEGEYLRVINDNYVAMEYLKNQPEEAYEGIVWVDGLNPYQRRMKATAFVLNWLSNNRIDVSGMSDSQKIEVIKRFSVREDFFDVGNEIFKIVDPENTFQLTAHQCGWYADVADAFMYAMGIRYTFYNLGGTVNGTAHTWNGYWDSDVGEVIFFDVGWGHYNMRYPDLGSSEKQGTLAIYVLETT